MSTIVLRLVKASPLTNAEVDSNFANLNTDKIEYASAAQNSANDTSSLQQYITFSNDVDSNVIFKSATLRYVPTTGTLSATDFNSSSDTRLKHDIKVIESGVETVDLLDPVEFKWNSTGKQSAGLIAQDVELILPHLVNTNNDGFKEINYSGVVPYLIRAIQELNARIQILESR